MTLIGFLIIVSCLLLLTLTVYVGYVFHRERVYFYWKYDFIRWVNKRAHAWLYKHDLDYQLRVIGNEVVRQREMARQHGASEDELAAINYHTGVENLRIKIKLPDI